MTTTPTTLRTLYPEFASTTAYPDPMVQTYLTLGAQFVNVDRWGVDLVDYGVHLWAAHHLTIAKQNARSPGSSGGPISSKSVDGVSASYDVSSVTEQGAGFWNGTSYGREFYRLSQMMGIGPVQVGTDGGQIATSTGWGGVVW